MKKIIPVVFLLCWLQSGANINFLTLEKWSKKEPFKERLNFLRDNLKYFDSWTFDWKYDVSRDKLIAELHECINTFGVIKEKDIEITLLKGDICHYLYNLNQEEYFSIAENYYKSAITQDPKDYRGYWFLGYHYALPTKANLSMENLVKAEKLLPRKEPAQFWDEFAYAAYIATMPSHCMLAMDKEKAILGHPGSFEAQLGDVVKNKMIKMYSDSGYVYTDIWEGEKSNVTTLISRPLGIKMIIDTAWAASPNDFNFRMTDFTLSPPRIKNKKGKDIGFNIAMIVKLADTNQTIEEFVSKVSGDYPGKKKVDFSIKNAKTVAYEIKIDTMYRDIGGAHLHVVGIEKDMPKYPGLLLEEPSNMQTTFSADSNIKIYTPKSPRQRFEGKIMYIFILDTCEDIHEKSYAVFRDFIQNKLIIE